MLENVFYLIALAFICYYEFIYLRKKRAAKDKYIDQLEEQTLRLKKELREAKEQEQPHLYNNIISKLDKYRKEPYLIEKYIL